MSTIESVLKETRSFAPSDAFRQKATISGMEAYNALCEQANQDYAGYWGGLARDLLTCTSRSPRCSTTAMRRSSNGLPMVSSTSPTTASTVIWRKAPTKSR